MSEFHGLPCWYELATTNTEASEGFYEKVMGWTWVDSGMPGMHYLLGKADKDMVAGLMKAREGQPAAWSIYFAVNDCDTTAAAAARLGAKVIAGPDDIPNTGRFAIIIDPQGAVFAILQPVSMPDGSGGQAFNQQKMGHGNWHDLITPDPVAAMDFYGQLFSWTVSSRMAMGPDMTYQIFAREGLDIGGTFAMPDTPPQWKPYFGIASARIAMDAVTTAGGKVLRGPDQVPGGAFTVQIMDPQGAVFAVVGPA